MFNLFGELSQQEIEELEEEMLEFEKNMTPEMEAEIRNMTLLMTIATFSEQLINAVYEEPKRVARIW